MLPQNKALELVKTINSKLSSNTDQDRTAEAKECANLIVEEIIKSRSEDKRFDDKPFTYSQYYTPNPLYSTYWELVKREIEEI